MVALAPFVTSGLIWYVTHEARKAESLPVFQILSPGSECGLADIKSGTLLKTWPARQDGTCYMDDAQ